MEWSEEKKKKKREYNKKYFSEVETEEVREKRLAKSRERSKKHYLANKEKYAENHRKYYAANTEKVLEKNREWDKNNPESRRKIRQKYYHKNKEYYSAKQKEYQKHPEFRLRSKAAHARQRAEGDIFLKDIQKIYEDNIAQHGVLTCYICKKAIEIGRDSIDHKIPVTKGGTNELSNIGVAHILCNNKKHNNILESDLTT